MTKWRDEWYLSRILFYLYSNNSLGIRLLKYSVIDVTDVMPLFSFFLRKADERRIHLSDFIRPHFLMKFVLQFHKAMLTLL